MRHRHLYIACLIEAEHNIFQFSISYPLFFLAGIRFIYFSFLVISNISQTLLTFFILKYMMITFYRGYRLYRSKAKSANEKQLTSQRKSHIRHRFEDVVRTHKHVNSCQKNY